VEDFAMLRVTTPARDGWQRTVESQGLTFHTLGGEPYWDESACYLFRPAEIDTLEEAAQALHAMCLEVVQQVVEERLFGLFLIPETFVDLVARLRESAHAVDDAPEAWIARQLDVAIKAKSPLAVSVGMPDDKTVVFLVTPLSLAAGRLRAIDEKAGVERTLPLRNITAVAPAP
jgi:hypothetical protein